VYKRQLYARFAAAALWEAAGNARIKR